MFFTHGNVKITVDLITLMRTLLKDKSDTHRPNGSDNWHGHGSDVKILKLLPQTHKP